MTNLAPSQAVSPRATLLGTGAILLWSSLALLITKTHGIPLFQLMAMGFGISGGTGLIWLALRKRLGALRQPLSVWALGLYGLFVYHSLYFSALNLAPPADVSLINFLWPLLVVLMSATLPGEHLRRTHVLAALLGLAGVAMLILGQGGAGFQPHYLIGYGLAFITAFVWSSYSVLSRRMASVPTDAIVGSCLITAVLAACLHLFFEPTITDIPPSSWLVLIVLGLGPLGVAFFLWDIGMKHGDIRFLGVASYATPILSTLILVAAGEAKPTASLFIACLLIVSAALIARK